MTTWDGDPRTPDIYYSGGAKGSENDEFQRGIRHGLRSLLPVSTLGMTAANFRRQIKNIVPLLSLIATVLLAEDGSTLLDESGDNLMME